jgi:hypothetical protein
LFYNINTNRKNKICTEASFDDATINRLPEVCLATQTFIASLAKYLSDEIQAKSFRNFTANAKTSHNCSESSQSLSLIKISG